MQKRIYIRELQEHVGEEAVIKGWVDVRRDQGKMIFLDFRDMSGMVQGVILPNASDAMEVGKKLRNEFVVEVFGKVNARPEKSRKEGVLNGGIELEILKINILNESEVLPFPINEDTKKVDEAIRLKYRYLDLRSERMQKNIRKRDRLITFFREYMHANDFVEIETPLLIKGTPEGSREYLVPSRLEHGKFYALPQSPQQFKQLSMVAGFEKYFQIARCMRDEDTRGDRQPEFTQLDYEMSFVEQEDVLRYTEKMFLAMIERLYPEKTITEKPFPRMTYDDAMKNYATDKPDLRKDKNNPNELAFCWVVDFPMYEMTDDGELQAAHHPFCQVKPEDKEKFMKGEDLMSIRANSYDLVLNGYELSSGSIRIHDSAEQKKVFELMKMPEDIIQKKFGHILEAFTFGCPPHGGFAPGIDRIMMILENEPNIREVIAFAKTGEGKDLMMGAPSEMPTKQLEELGIALKK